MGGDPMHATIRRYEGIDPDRNDELHRLVGEHLIPQLEELEGFRGYYLIDAHDGTTISVSLFDTWEQAADSSRVSAAWVLDAGFADAVPAPTITVGEVTAHS
jgi:hypothetical protein